MYDRMKGSAQLQQFRLPTTAEHMQRTSEKLGALQQQLDSAQAAQGAFQQSVLQSLASLSLRVGELVAAGSAPVSGLSGGAAARGAPAPAGAPASAFGASGGASAGDTMALALAAASTSVLGSSAAAGEASPPELGGDAAAAGVLALALAPGRASGLVGGAAAGEAALTAASVLGGGTALSGGTEDAGVAMLAAVAAPASGLRGGAAGAGELSPERRPAPASGSPTALVRACVRVHQIHAAASAIGAARTAGTIMPSGYLPAQQLLVVEGVQSADVLS